MGRTVARSGQFGGVSFSLENLTDGVEAAISVGTIFKQKQCSDWKRAEEWIRDELRRATGHEME